MVDLFESIFCSQQDTTQRSFKLLIFSHVFNSNQLTTSAITLCPGLWNMGPMAQFLTLANSFGVGPHKWIKVMFSPNTEILLPICPHQPQKIIFFLCICIITCGFHYMGAGNVLCRSHSLNFLSMTCPHFEKKCLICAWTHCRKRAAWLGQLEGQLGHSWQLVSPVTTNHSQELP